MKSQLPCCCAWAGTPFETFWKEEVFDRNAEVDPGKEQDWFSLCLGWALGKGMSLDEAHNFAIHIRYHTNLG